MVNWNKWLTAEKIDISQLIPCWYRNPQGCASKGNSVIASPPHFLFKKKKSVCCVRCRAYGGVGKRVIGSCEVNVQPMEILHISGEAQRSNWDPHAKLLFLHRLQAGEPPNVILIWLVHFVVSWEQNLQNTQESWYVGFLFLTGFLPFPIMCFPGKNVACSLKMPLCEVMQRSFLWCWVT